MARTCVALFLATFLVTIPVAAQISLTGVSANAIAVVPSTDAIVAPLTPIRIPAAARPSVLPSMYVSLAALQGYDTYSTLRAVKLGAVEANPMMAGIVGHPAAFIAVKSGVTVASIYAAEHLWKSGHRAEAIAMIAVTNGLMTAVAVNNANVMRRMR